MKKPEQIEDSTSNSNPNSMKRKSRAERLSARNQDIEQKQQRKKWEHKKQTSSAINVDALYA